MILDKINNPSDLKKLSVGEMNTLADEMRELIIEKVNTTGGHMAPNLGVIETTIAFHYVFNSPEDKIIFDVSHQCYPHKILTGRKEGFLNPESYLKYTGYTAPEESEHDLFKVGHTSTAASLACGLAKARDIQQITIPVKFDPIYEKYNDLQIKEGLNLKNYKGKTVKKYTYLVNNHSYEGVVYANVLIYKNRVIGGDICSAVSGGFMHGFTKDNLFQT